MAEQYDVAAWRHHRVGEMLENGAELDDAGYHFGVCGENAVKYALWASGVQAAWIRIGAGQGKSVRDSLTGTPMRGHFPTLTTLVQQTRSNIAVHATGRFSGPVAAIVLSPNFIQRFAGWSIDIRYADTQHTPVSSQTCTAWHADADDLVLSLVI